MRKREDYLRELVRYPWRTEEGVEELFKEVGLEIHKRGSRQWISYLNGDVVKKDGTVQNLIDWIRKRWECSMHEHAIGTVLVWMVTPKDRIDEGIS